MKVTFQSCVLVIVGLFLYASGKESVNGRTVYPLSDWSTDTSSIRSDGRSVYPASSRSVDARDARMESFPAIDTDIQDLSTIPLKPIQNVKPTDLQLVNTTQTVKPFSSTTSVSSAQSSRGVFRGRLFGGRLRGCAGGRCR